MRSQLWALFLFNQSPWTPAELNQANFPQHLIKPHRLHFPSDYPFDCSLHNKPRPWSQPNLHWNQWTPKDFQWNFGQNGAEKAPNRNEFPWNQKPGTPRPSRLPPGSQKTPFPLHSSQTVTITPLPDAFWSPFVDSVKDSRELLWGFSLDSNRLEQSENQEVPLGLWDQQINGSHCSLFLFFFIRRSQRSFWAAPRPLFLSSPFWPTQAALDHFGPFKILEESGNRVARRRNQFFRNGHLQQRQLRGNIHQSQWFAAESISENGPSIQRSQESLSSSEELQRSPEILPDSFPNHDWIDLFASVDAFASQRKPKKAWERQFWYKLIMESE